MPAGTPAGASEKQVMVVVIFRSRVMEDRLPEYYRRVEEMAAIASRMPGYISHKGFTADDGERVSIHEWESEAALAAWRDHPSHLQMQQYGREKFYEEYTLQVLASPRESRFQRRKD
jgi:heme-degrading monooxygenase HmoA